MGDTGPLLTRRQGVDLVRAEGIPLTKSRVDKDSALKKGPRPAARFGKQDLYTREEFRAYARGLLKSTEMEAA